MHFDTFRSFDDDHRAAHWRSTRRAAAPTTGLTEANEPATQRRREALADGLIRRSAAGDDEVYRHALQAGRWAYRIAQVMQYAPDPDFVRCCAVLADLDPAIICANADFGPRYAHVLDAYQEAVIIQNAPSEQLVSVRIIDVAKQFDELIGDYSGSLRMSAPEAIAVLRSRFPICEEIIEALVVLSNDI